MFTKRLFQNAAHRHQHQKKGLLTSDDVNIRINVHYGIPSTASILAFDPIQRLLAIGTLDGRIKVIGGNNIEGLLISPKLSAYKYLEFLQNQGFLVSITTDNDIQVWDLERRSIACSLQWESNVTAFSVISGSSFMYAGDEYGLMSVLKYDLDSGQLLQTDYQLTPDSLAGLLIAYASGLIILWDVVEANVVAVRGDKVLQLKDTVIRPNNVDANSVDDAPSHDLEEKEISALCWASTDGSIIAVGYIDGDILFWHTSKDSFIKDRDAGMSTNVVKLQLSSAKKRLPVIVLHWLDQSKSCDHREGQLLIYGGDEIGCEEVVTMFSEVLFGQVLSLEMSSGVEAIKCRGRVDLTLTGSFADMILIPYAGTTESDSVSLFVLSNPGRIHIYDRGSLSSTDLQLRKDQPVSTVNFSACIPTVDPLITVAEIFNIYGSMEEIGSKISAVSSNLTLPGHKIWPLTGGVCNHISFGEDNKVHRLYVAGYQDGSIRIWDATYPVFSLLCVLANEFNSQNSGTSLTVVDLCSSTLRLAFGSQCGLVKLYNLCSNDETSFHFVTETTREVRTSAQFQGPRCTAVFNLQKSGVHALIFTSNGSKLIVGYESSRIAVLDVYSSSVAFITDPLPNSPVISVFSKAIVYETTKITTGSPPKVPDNCREELMFVLTKNASIYVIDGNNGSMIGSRPLQLKKSTAVSVYVIESQAAVRRSGDKQPSLKDDMSSNDLSQDGAQWSEKCETNNHSLDTNLLALSLKELYVLLCCKDSLRLYPAKSVVRGESKPIYKIKLSKPCCWTTVFRKTEEVCGLVVFYETGVIEIRSLPDLELVREFPLMSYLRWNIKANMERMISSTANGSEVAFISLLEGENDFRIPESLPSLHDEVLAAAANAAFVVPSDPKRKQVLQGGSHGVLGGILKGFRRRKSNKSMCHDLNYVSDFCHLEDIFIRKPFPEPSTTTRDKEAADLTIDDIEIDESLPLTSTSSHAVEFKDKDKKNERKQLLDDGAEIKPRIKTKEEIIAKYRNVGFKDASSAAGQARNKLLERQEKLERISRRTEDLQNGAEDFASLANELVKTMENRKWYHI
ncbi:hypothetical protein OROHE_013313 [Orobanche hederae]